MSLIVPLEEIFNDKGLLCKAPHWGRVELALAVSIQNGFPLKSSAFNSENGFPIIRIRDLKFNKVQTYYSQDFPKEYIVTNGDLLVGMDGDFICYEWGGGQAALNQRVCRLIPNELFLLKRFLFYGINGYLNAIQKATSSVTVGHLSSVDTGKIPFPLPPLPEQRRIVAKLDAIMQKVQSNKQRIDKIPKLLKRFRQSVLAAAVSGKLTEDWREKNLNTESAAELILRIQDQRKKAYENALKNFKEGKAKKPKTPTDITFNPLINIIDDLPSQWCETRIGDISECLDYIRKPINKTERINRPGTVPYFGANGQVGWIDNYLFDEDLIVIVEDETFIGREIPFSYIIRGKSWVNNHAHVMKPLAGISVEYLNICWAYYDFTPLTSGTTGRRKLTQGALVNAEFALAPLNEQKEIVRRVERLFSYADKIDARYTKARTTLDKLPQSILAKAFRGELVPQNPDDEPASVLLERIKDEKDKMNGEKMKKNSKEPV